MDFYYINLSLLIFFILKSLRDILNFLWIFQTKEYRLDRVKSYIKEEMTRKKPVPSFFWTLFLLATFIYLLKNMWAIAFVYFYLSFIKIVFEIYKRKLKRPKPTLKIILVATLSCTLYAFLSFSIYKTVFFETFYLVLFDLIIPVIVILSILIVTPFSDRKKKNIKEKARKKMGTMKHIRTIGITGSYGKTSTKELLYQILSSRYKVVKTKDNNNTAIGVSNTIINRVKDNFDFFICEMGAYRIGEIEEICNIAKPEIGVITGINEQHIDLFGSINNTKTAKFELIKNLPNDGTAFINEEVNDIGESIKIDIEDLFYFSKKLAKNITVYPDFIEFEYKDEKFKANVLGKHYISNLISAIMVSEKLGMSLEEIKEAIEKMEIGEDQFVKKLKGLKGSIFIDDSYSANPDGVIASIEYVKEAYPEHKKIFVFPGIIELGQKSKTIHKKIWKATNDCFDDAYLILDFDKDIQEEFSNCRVLFERDFDKIAEKIAESLDEKTIVLFESRGAGVVMKKILNLKK